MTDAELDAMILLIDACEDGPEDEDEDEPTIFQSQARQGPSLARAYSRRDHPGGQHSSRE